jgi:transcription-repair coupling factor (superfamily II helicase)
VENIHLIKKYGHENAALDKLGSTYWQKRCATLKNKIKDIAKQLIKTTASRQLSQTKPVNIDIVSFEEFCDQFEYVETDDQLNAINDVQEDLTSGRLMDRLICGDVGFGKTEVAMRSAFMAAFDSSDSNPQVAIIAPTTILAKQHYGNFKQRFGRIKDSQILQISRLVTPKQLRENKLKIASGEANIIIGTHALLSDSVKFHNLRLLIIDEEHNFGVAQKEKLKQLRAKLHVLSLSATPIPRTLQMSMIGIKDLSLIATPPIDRLPVKTIVMPFDIVVLREALIKEKFRGGKSFYVCPRIKDIEFIKEQIVKFIPEITFSVAHGQMPPTAIEDVMNDFCDGNFDLLISTTIIESGIDIQAANTIIIHRADMLGLSQLYQLRGRVGRSKIRGYAYLTTMPGQISNDNVYKRLEVLQNIDTLGAGFTIASHDMDMRGFGNLVGEEQSGHIREVGSELYYQMLEEAIEELKNDDKDSLDLGKDETPSINLSIPIFIPGTYIEDSSLRLAIYRRIGNLKTQIELELFEEEMIDRFGTIPQEFHNLLEVVKIRNTCYKLSISSIDTGPNGFVLKFNATQNSQIVGTIMEFIKKYPRHAKLKTDKLVYLKVLTNDNILLETKRLIQDIYDLTGLSP